MNIRKLKKLIKTEKLNNHQKSILSTQLIQMGYKSGLIINKFLIRISKKLDLYIYDINKIEPSNFISSIEFRDICLVEKVKDGWIHYYRSYSICDTPKYWFLHNSPYRGKCKMSLHYRKMTSKEMFKIPHVAVTFRS